MTVYAYRALGAAHGRTSGKVSADTPREARDLIRSRGLVVEEVRSLERKSSRGAGALAAGRSGRAAIEFVRELSTMLSVGIPLASALTTLAKEARGRLQASILALRDRVSAGASLAQAMEEEPEVFDELLTRMVAVGERSGTLEEVLRRVAEFRERSAELRGRVGNALIYPAIVLAMAAVVSVLLMTFVVPNILEPLVQAGRELPVITRVVKGASDLLLEWGLPILAAAAAGVTALSMFLRSAPGRRAFDRALLALPYLGAMARKEAVVRIALVLSTLLRSGIVFLEALAATERATRNSVLRAALRSAAEAVQGGADLGEALRRTGAFPAAVVEVFALGQESGQLEDMLERLGADYDRAVHSAAQRFASVLEPILILLLALLVGAIAFATILPVLEAGHVL